MGRRVIARNQLQEVRDKLLDILRGQRKALNQMCRGAPVQGLLPIPAREEIDPLMVPQRGALMTVIVMRHLRREQQQISFAADKALGAIGNQALSLRLAPYK